MNEYTQANVISDEDLFICGACAETSLWKEAYYQDKTPGTPLSIGTILDQHHRVFCPKCGHVIAEHIDNTGDMAWVEDAKPAKAGQKPRWESGQRIYSRQWYAPYGKQAADLQGFLRSIENEIKAFKKAQEQTLEKLLTEIKSFDDDVRRASATALGKFKDVRAAEALVAAFDRTNNLDFQHACESSLEGMGIVALMPLANALKHKASFVRYRAVWTLSTILGNMNDEALSALNDDNSEDTRRVVSEALLLALTRDDSLDIRRTAAAALGAMKHRPALETLVSTLKSGGELGQSACSALANLVSPEDKNMVHIFKDALNDKDIFTQFAAARALIRIGEVEAAIPTLANLLGRLAGVVDVLGKLGPAAAPAVPALIKNIRDSYKYHDSMARRDAAEVLGGIGAGAEAAIPILEELLKDGSEDVRKAAEESLTKIRGSGDNQSASIKRRKSWWKFWKR